MEMAKLKAANRSGRGKGAARKTRAQGQVPGVVYGLHKDPVTVAIDPMDVTVLLRTSPWRRNTVVDLSVDGGAGQPVLIQELSVHPVSRELLHIDLLHLDFDRKLRVEVPVKLTGKPEGVKAGGLLQQLVRTLKIECLPMDIPIEIEIDVSSLDRKASMSVEQVVAPAGTRLLFTDPFPVAVVS